MNKEQILFFFSSIATSIVNGTRKIENQEFDRILIIKLDEIGDMLYILHVIDALVESHPNVVLDIWCKKMNNILVEDRITGTVYNRDSVLKNKYDLVLDLRGSFRTMLWSLGRNVAWRLDRGTVRLRNKLNEGQKHEKITNWEIAQPVLKVPFRNPELRLEPSSLELVKELLVQLNVSDYVLMHTGARDEIRRWPIDRFKELAEKLNQETGLPILICGGPEERASLEKQFSHISFIKIVAGRTNLNELGFLASRAKLFIGNESGPLHFATLAQIPIIALFGPGVRNVFYPYGADSRIIHPMGQPVEERMANISVEEVYTRAVELLDA